MKLAEAWVEVRLDTKKAKQQAQGEVESLGKGLGGAFARVFSAAVIAGGIMKSVDAASDLNETVSKTQVVFGKSGAEITKWADNSAKSFGLSKRAALDAVDTFAIFGQGAGLAGDDLSKFSKDLVGLSADLASFYNTSPEDAINAIGAALRGESEPIRAYGVLLDDATLKQRAMTMGLYDGKGALDQHSRVLAAQAEILAQTGKAQGDFARTADGAANSQRIAKAEAENAAASLGQNFLPIYERIVKIVGAAAEVFGSLPGPIQTSIVALAALVVLAGPIKNVASVVGDFSKALKKVVTDAGGLKGALGQLGPTALGVGSVIAAAATIYTVYSNNKHAAAERTKELREALLSEGDAQKDALTALAQGDFHVKEFLETQRELGISTGQLTQFVKDGTGPLNDLVAAFEAAGGESGDWTNQQRILRDELGLGDDTSQAYLASIRQFILEALKLKGAQEDNVATQELVNEVVGDGTVATDTQTAALASNTTALGDNTAISRQAKDAEADLRRERDDANDTLREEIDRHWDLVHAIEALQAKELEDIDAKYALESANRAATKAAQDADAATDNQADSIERARQAAEEAAIKFADMNAENASGKDKVQLMIDSLTLQAQALGPDSEVARAINEYILQLAKIPTSITTNVKVSGNSSIRGGQSAMGRFVPGGSNFFTSTGERSGRAGDEAILPLGDRNRLQQLLGDPRIGPRVADALGMDSGGGSSVTKSVTFTGDIVSNVDFDGAWRMANFFLAGLN